MAKKRFPIETCNWPASTPEETERWRAACERAGPDVIRAQAAHVPARAAISIDSEMNVTAGFAHEWLRWMDEQTSAREDGLKSRSLFWTRFGIIFTVIATVIGAIWTLGSKTGWRMIPWE